MTVNNLHIMYYANSYRTMILQRCWLHMNYLLLYPTVSEKKKQTVFQLQTRTKYFHT